MNKLRKILSYAAVGLLLIALNSGQVSAQTETNSRTVEDGGTGAYSTLMVTDSTLVTHTIFRPKDLSVFGKKNKLPIIGTSTT